MMINFEQTSLFNHSAAANNTQGNTAVQVPTHAINSASTHPIADTARLTEISLHSNPALAKSILAGMLLELSENADQRWLCWVADRPLKPLLDSNSQARKPNRILQVVNNKHTANCPSLTEIAVRALERGKSHTVAVLVDGNISERERIALAHAATAGNAQCLLIKIQ
ncbi:hypothetical protein IB286_08710 [Spongiibacter sp. KMU-158]|uniref:Cell division inhibitor SulA n=1 Tax=Spongiibacter pelagi TaxID=2760804 RepID=A0A927C1N4_9GAMM|nr:hypothetical protein [Spongiibacter pelagi]MBD2859089.1 hypothetical protein [Spongiibacter pelagi]